MCDNKINFSFMLVLFLLLSHACVGVLLLAGRDREGGGRWGGGGRAWPGHQDTVGLFVA